MGNEDFERRRQRLGEAYEERLELAARAAALRAAYELDVAAAAEANARELRRRLWATGAKAAVIFFLFVAVLVVSSLLAR